MTPATRPVPDAYMRRLLHWGARLPVITETILPRFSAYLREERLAAVNGPSLFRIWKAWVREDPTRRPVWGPSLAYRFIRTYAADQQAVRGLYDTILEIEGSRRAEGS